MVPFSFSICCVMPALCQDVIAQAVAGHRTVRANLTPPECGSVDYNTHLTAELIIQNMDNAQYKWSLINQSLS